MTIDLFQEKIMSLQANNFMALNGAASGIVGSADSGTDAIMQLKRAVVNFGAFYKAGDNDGYLAASRKEVLAKLMVAVTVGALAQETADELITELQQLMKERN